MTESNRPGYGSGASRPAAVLITGASRGIGRATAVEFARAGAHVLINYRGDEEAARATLAAVVLSGGTAELARFDVADRGETRAAVAKLLERYDIDVLVNNAGVTDDGLFVQLTDAAWDRVVETSIDGFFNVTRPVVEQMIKRGRGAVVNVSSVAAFTAHRGQVHYAAAKAALNAATRTLAAEVARLGVRVNAVAPGLIETDMTEQLPRERLKQLVPMARLGRADEVARVVTFLCSDAASYVTGEVVVVAGGLG